MRTHHRSAGRNKRIQILEIVVFLLTALHFAVPLLGLDREIFYFILISAASLFTLIITCRVRNLKAPGNAVVLLVSFSNFISLCFFAIDHKFIFHGLSVGTLFLFSLIGNPYVFLFSGTLFLGQNVNMLVMLKKWEFFEYPLLTVISFLFLVVLLFKNARDKECMAEIAGNALRVSNESKSILLGEDSTYEEGERKGNPVLGRNIPVEEMMAEMMKDALHRLRFITKAEFVYLFRPVTSTGLRWYIAAHSTEHGEKEEMEREVDGGWEPIKVPYLLGKEFISEEGSTGLTGFPFERTDRPESLYSFPIFSKRAPVAVLYFEKHFAGSFSRIEREAVAMGSEFLSRAFSLMSLIAKMQAGDHTYPLFDEYVKDMLAAKGVVDIYPSAARKISDTVKAATVCILVQQKGTKGLQITGLEGMDQRKVSFGLGDEFDCTGTIIQWCMDNEIHRIINYGARAQERISNLPPPMDTVSKGRQVIILPFAGQIGKGRRIRGAVIVFGNHGQAFTNREVEKVGSIVNVTLLALPRAFDYDRLEGESRRDPLTGLLNRKELFVKLRKEISKAMRTRGVVSFLILDIDDFKNLNDTFGHPFGDEVIVTVSRIMQNIVRPYDTVARYGGEEFSIILYGADRLRAKGIADRISAAVRNKSFTHGGREVRITISIGIATYPDDSPSIDSLVEMADRALYHAKDSGKDRVSSVPDIMPE